MKITAGTLMGPYHASSGLPNQDACDYFHDPETDLTVIAVADGAGSLERSDQGAQLAVLHFGKRVLGLKDEFENLREVVEKSFWEVIEAIAEENDREIGSTLIVFVSDDKEWVCASVGDSFGVLQNADGSLDLLKAPSDAEFANQTVLLTSKNIGITFYQGEVSEISGIALSSDGLENSTVVKSTGTPVSGFWNAVFKRSAEGNLDVKGLLEYMLNAGKLDDDTTLVVASFEGGEE